MTQSIVLIDLHQLNVKQLQTIQISDTEYGATSCQRRTEPGRSTRNIRFRQMIEQINIALEQKRVENFSAWVVKPPKSEITSEKSAYTSIKDDEEDNVPRSSHPNRTMCKFT